ncbi:MAG: HAD family phosphatase [Maritimibacter sp.]|nr:HAD family phosphatase [Maritimibacter sp.]
MNPKAFIWDMDGTLIDSEPTYLAALEAVLSSAGQPPVPDLHENIIGLTSEATYTWLRDTHGLTLAFEDWSALKFDLYARNADELAPIPGAMELWTQVSALGLPQAIASNADRLFVDVNLRQLGLNRPGLVTVSRNDVRAGKPDPEMYLRAAWLLGVDPADAIAIEDSPTGARAALAAGIQTFMIGANENDVPDGACHATTYRTIFEFLSS